VFLPAHLEGKLESPGIERGSGLSSRAGAGSRVAKRADVGDIEAVQHIEAVRDHFEIQALGDGKLARDTQIDLEKARPREGIAPERARASKRRRGDSGERAEGRSGAVDAAGRNDKFDPFDKRRGNCSRKRSAGFQNGWPVSRCSKVEVGVETDQNVVGSARSDLNDRSHGEIGENFLQKAGIAFVIGTQDNSAGNPAMPLIEIGVAALQVREAVVLRIQEGGEIGGIIDGMRIGPAGKEFEIAREAFGHAEGEGMVDAIAIGGLGVHIAPGNPDAAREPGRESGSPRNLYQCGVAAGNEAGERGIGTRRPEEIEDRWRPHEADWRSTAIREGKPFSKDTRNERSTGLKDQNTSAARCVRCKRAGGAPRERAATLRDRDAKRVRSRRNQSASHGLTVVAHEQGRIRDIDIHCTVQMCPMSVVVPQADLPIFGELAFDGKIGLLRQSVLEAFFDGNGEGQESKRESSGDEVLVGKNGIRLKGVEALLLWQVAG